MDRIDHNKPSILQETDVSYSHPTRNSNFIGRFINTICQSLYDLLKKIWNAVISFFTRSQPEQTQTNQLTTAMTTPVSCFLSLPGLPGEWHMMNKSQISLQTPSGCAVYALKVISNILNCQGQLDVIAEFDQALDTMAPVIRANDPTGTAQYDIEEIQRSEGYNQYLQINNNFNPVRFVCDALNPSFVEIENETSCTSRAQVLQLLFDSQGKKSFAATILGGPETLAIYQRSPAEIYLFDSHKPIITLNNGSQTHFENAYIGKFSSREELSRFLLHHRFYCEAEVEDVARLQATLIESQ